MESDEFWDFYWEMRLQGLQNLGKKEAILAISRLIRRMESAASRADAPLAAADPQAGPSTPLDAAGARVQSLRLLELGCGEAQIIGPLVEGHARVCPAGSSVGVDYLPASIQVSRRDYPLVTFIEGDFTDAALLEKLGRFEIVLLVNALHEVFSTTFSEALGEVDVPAARLRVEQAFLTAADRVAPGGYMVLFDGLEPPGDIHEKIRVRFLDPTAREHFETFAREYHPFRISYRAINNPYTIELSRRDFTRYITKSIFLGKRLWQSERLESYQYYNEQEFRSVFARAGLEIQELRTLTVDDEKWRRAVEILTPGMDFPEEHILIIAKKS